MQKGRHETSSHVSTIWSCCSQVSKFSLLLLFSLSTSMRNCYGFPSWVTSSTFLNNFALLRAKMNCSLYVRKLSSSRQVRIKVGVGAAKSSMEKKVTRIEIYDNHETNHITTQFTLHFRKFCLLFIMLHWYFVFVSSI